jgi:hypothetical protein
MNGVAGMPLALAPARGHTGGMKPPDTVTASEIADWVYYPESLRLAEVGHPSANQLVLDAGVIHHDALAVVETRAGGSIALGRVLIVLGVLAALAACVWR